MGGFVILSVCGDGEMNDKQAWYYEKFFGKFYSLQFFVTF